MKLSKKAKLIFGFSIFTIIYIFCIYFGVKNQNINLNETQQIIGIVENRGIDIRFRSKGKKDKVFYIKLKELNKKLGIYRMSKNYNDLIRKINIGDQLTIYYFENTNQTENVNINIVQVERNNIVLVDKKEFENKERFLIYFGFLGIIANILILNYNRKRYFKSKKRQLTGV